MSPDLELNTLSAFPRGLTAYRSGIMDSAPSLQWRDRAGLSPASILASAWAFLPHLKNIKPLFTFNTTILSRLESNFKPFSCLFSLFGIYWKEQKYVNLHIITVERRQRF
jgi:hypothetical protein